MPQRPERFDQIVGHKNLIDYFLNHLNNNSLPSFIILDGEEGLGKTSFAKLLAMGLCCEAEGNKPCYHCKSCQEIAQRVIRENKDTESVKLYNMSINDGKDAAKSLVQELNLGISGNKHKVIIMDEAHGMKKDAQSVFLVDTEYLPEGVHIIMATTDTFNLQATLKSRAVTLRLSKLTQAEMVKLLKQEVERLALNVQGGEKTLNLIAAWADGKPRIALNLLGAFGKGANVSSDMVKEFINFIDVSDIIPLIQYLGGSMTHGLAYVSEMKLNSSVLDILIEALKIKKGQASYKLTYDDVSKLRPALSNVSEESLIKLIYEMAAMPTLTRTGMIAAFLKAHESYDLLYQNNPTALTDELRQKSEVAPLEPEVSKSNKAPSLDSLLRSGSIIK